MMPHVSMETGLSGTAVYDHDHFSLRCGRPLSPRLPAPQKTGIAKEAGGAFKLVYGMREGFGGEGELPSPLVGCWVFLVCAHKFLDWLKRFFAVPSLRSLFDTLIPLFSHLFSNLQ